MTISLGWLPETAFLHFLVFARVGTMLMLVPALGERFIPARVRLGFALVFAVVIQPLVAPGLPGLPGEPFAMLGLVLHEIAIGLILGGIARLVVMATQTAGAIIAYQTGLSMAQTADPTGGGVQGAIVGNFLSMLAVALIFVTDLHHLILAAVFESYVLFPPGSELMLDDAAQMVVRGVAGAFVIGVQMAAPFIVFGLVFYLGLGLLARLMPQLQVFFIAMPANISLGFLLLALLLAMMMGWYMLHFEEWITMLRPGNG